MTPADLLPYVLEHVHGCDDLVAERHVRLAVIELCRKALVWQAAIPTVTTVAGQTEYTWAPAAGQVVVKLLKLRLDGLPVRLLVPAEGQDWDAANVTATYAYGTLGGFSLHPAPAVGRTVVPICALAPTLAADTFPDAIGTQWAEEIGHGAVHRLMGMPGLPYSNLPRAEALRQLWEQQDIPRAAALVAKGNTRAVRRTVAQWF